MNQAERRHADISARIAADRKNSPGEASCSLMGSERAFERLYRRHVADVYRYASAVLSNPADAEDVTQTTFLNAYRALEQGQRPERSLNWLITIAHNVCRQRFRQQSRRPNEVALDFDVADELVDEDRPRAEDIRFALSQLAFNQRAALVLRELEGRSYAEIAQTLDLSASAVETLVFRARRALREQLEGGLTCGEVELAVSRQLDGALPRGERGALRAHLRSCPDCASLARSMRAQRSSLKKLGVLQLPAALASFSGGAGGGATLGAAAGAGGGFFLKVAAVTLAGLAVSGAGYKAVADRHHAHPAAHAARESAALPVTRRAPVAPVTAVHTKPVVAKPTRVSHIATGRQNAAAVHAVVAAKHAAHEVAKAVHAAAVQAKHGTKRAHVTKPKHHGRPLRDAAVTATHGNGNGKSQLPHGNSGKP